MKLNGSSRYSESDSARLNFYEIDRDYIDELKSVDSKIPDIDYAVHRKFICGMLFRIGDFEYFAPVSSFKKTQKTNFMIKNKSGSVVGSLRFSFMFPVVKVKRWRKDFSSEDEKRKNLLIEELAYCNAHACKIRSKAKHVYDTAVSGKDPRISEACCDFKVLEAYVRQHYAPKS